VACQPDSRERRIVVAIHRPRATGDLRRDPPIMPSRSLVIFLLAQRDVARSGL
jgi:hypothetical protein